MRSERLTLISMLRVSVSAGDALPSRMVFTAYSSESSRLPGGETHGTRMRESHPVDGESVTRPERVAPAASG
jgi:hypothetical protein